MTCSHDRRMYSSKTISTLFDDLWRPGLGACWMLPRHHAEKSYRNEVRDGNAVQSHSFMFML